MKRVFIAVGFILLAPVGSLAEGLRVLPENIVLSGTLANQRVLLLAEENGRAIGDKTDGAKFTSSNPQVATVDEAGVVQAVGDGEAVITVSKDGKQATAK